MKDRKAQGCYEVAVQHLPTKQKIIKKKTPMLNNVRQRVEKIKKNFN